MTELYKLCEIEEILAENDEYEGVLLVVDLDCDSRMELDSVRVYVPEYDLSLRSGTVSVFNDETGDYEPDFGVTAVYDGQDEDHEAWLYYEQDDMAVTLHNYLRSMNIDITGHPEYEGDCMCCALNPDEEYVPQSGS